jgi:hypothetical protein
MNRTLTSRALGQGHGLGLGCAFTDRAWRRHVSGVGALGGAILAAALLSLSACGGASGPGSDLGKVTSEIVTGVTPVLTISPGATNFTAQGAAIVVDPNLTLTISDGSDLPGVQVSISTGYVTGQDVLGFTPQAGVTGVWTAATGVLALTGTASVASYQTVLRSVTYNNTAANPNTQARVVTFSIGAGSLSFGGHYYEFVPTGLTWTAAKAAAAARTYYGLAGYLATITTAGENAFISAKLTATGWIGASDAANEGQWRWVTGPENGTLFYIENTLQSCPPAPDTCTQGTHTYASWNSGEPNNSGGENYAQFYAGGLGTWNDLNGTQALGYVVEYGGTAGDPTPQVSGPKAVTVSSLPNYSITASAGANGTISPIGVNSYQQGQSQIFTITPSTNYGVASVLVDGVSVGVVTTYTFSNVIANHTISATFSPPTIAVSAGNNQSANVAAAFGTPLSVLVSNSGGTPISGATVLFAAPGSGASATVTASATTNASGIASTTATANATAGGYNVTATIGGTTVATTFALRNLGAPSSIAVVSGGSQSAVVQGAFAAPLVAVVRDSTSFALPNVTVTFAAPSSAGASAALGATSVTTNASGQASVTATANTVAGTYAVAASAPGVGSAASFALANLAGVAAHIALTGGATQTTVVGAPFGAPIVASVTDTFGNPVSGATVTFAAPGSGASAALATPMPSTSAQGLAQSTVIANTVAGNYSVSASIAAGASATTMLANTAGAPALVMLTSGSGQIALAGAAFASPLGVAVVDTYGNTVSGATVAFTAIAAAGTGASATLTSGSAVTNAPGLASVLATANGSAGSYVVTAIAGGAPAASFALTNQFLLALSPTGASVAPRGSVTFAPTGGSGVGYVFAFQSAPSGGTIDPATGVYTAGATPLVTDVITVTDSQSHTATASISVGAALALAPLPTRVPPRGGAVFTATGGSQSGLVFTIVNNNSNGTIDSSGSYVAGQNDSVTDLVSVVDSLGNSATASIDVGPTVSLAASATSTPPRGSLSFAASGGSGTFTYALGQNQSGGRIDPATGAYTAGSVFDQTDEVTATDGLGNSASVNIAVGHGITVSPASPSVPPLGTFTLSASGGSGTGFAFTLGGGASGAISDPASGVYVAGAAPNASDLVTVTDSLGNTATTSISVGGGIRVSPSSLTTPPLGSQAFSVSGGSGAGYVFSLSSHPSGGTIDASTGGYTAGATGSTVDGLSVVDSLGNHATVVITVGPGLGLSPATATLAPLGHQAINVSGGSGSGYTFALSSNSSGGLVDALTGAYTAGAIGGVVDVVTAHDDLGNLATATLTLTPALTVAPSTLSAAPRASLSITASGGAPAYAFSLSSNGSGGTIDPATGAYTAGSNPDSADVITIMDHNGATTNLVVTVGPGVGILPAHPSVAPRGPIAFGGVNGSGTGYRFALADNQSGGTIVAATGAYTAGPTGDVADLVSVTDSLGNTTTVSVAVGGRLVLGPASASVAPRESLAVYAVAGSGTGYVYAFRTNASGGSIDATTGAYVAGVAPDVTDVILVTDSLGNTATTSIGVGPGLTVMPASASTAPRGTVSLTSAGGSATGYGFSLSTNGSSGSVSASGIYTAGATGDTVDVVTVTDSLGNTDTVTIMVGHALTVTATAGTVPPRGTTTFTAVGGVGGGYVFTVRTNGSGGNIVGSTGVYTAGDTASSTDIIEVTDPFGNRATLAVTVGPGITITPAALSAPPHGKLTLMATGGSGIGYHFALTSNASGGTLDATSGLYTAGSTTDVLDAVQVTDTLGNTANATIAVGGALTVNPSAPTVAPRDSMTFTAAGGNGSGFTFALATNASGGTIDATSGRYTAGALGNVQDIVTVSDPLGNLAHATIDVGDGLHVTPSTVQAAPLAKMTFTVSGGSGKGYSFALTTNTSQGTIDPGTGAYTAGAQGGGTDVVTVADSLGNTATASIHLGAALSTSTPTVTVAPNGTTIITVTGGGTMLTYTLTTNGSGGSINPVTGAYTAGPKGGTTDVITVSDGNHATVTITVQIGPSLSTKPLTGTVQTGQTITLSTAGGSGSGQHWTIVSAGSGGTVNATTGAYTAGPHAGVDVVQVVDSLGNSAQVSIPVTAAGATTVGSSGGGGCSCTLGTAGAVGLRTTALALGACGLVLLGRRRRRR